MKHLNHTVLFAGAGLSALAGLPTTRELTKRFLSLGPTPATNGPLQDLITAHLRTYWETVFSFRGNVTPSREPSFEDHFTLLDLAANTGHHLGTRYSPRQLRAIRRLSIHRVFDILDSTFTPNANLTTYLANLAQGAGNAVVTTNWDISIERHLEACPYHYSIPMNRLDGAVHAPAGIEILKLHGSSNWAYCDCCSRLFAFETGKGALHTHIFIENTDFTLWDVPPGVEIHLEGDPRHKKCPHCDVRLSSRVATFSYVKVLDFVHFQTIWDHAFKALRDASHWVFVGYSLPEADFQLRHMLKSAQLARSDDSGLTITIVTRNDDDTVDRFKRFFGDSLGAVVRNGFDEWLTSQHQQAM